MVTGDKNEEYLASCDFIVWYYFQGITSCIQQETAIC